MRTVVTRTRVARLAVVPLAVALLLSGCGRPGTAATVDGERITDAQLATLVEDLERLTASTPDAAPVAPSVALATFVQGPTIEEVGAEAGAAASDHQAIELLDGAAAQSSLEPWEYSPELVQFARIALTRQALQADAAASTEVGDRLAALDVELNPRFGTWDAGQVTPAAWPWLITPGSDVVTDAEAATP
ncbi:hypothetical protein [Serinibacter arcticus]|uniref:Lipoprotein n=1 Tax=Serinibacter arcticus TaxID=1655435 RepID=A0A4Z1E0M0_9MICO|nr:hypothetical protein [Serinibacter arcticus]TGO04192.1 hypothetical protein SERN_2783 [Serinibacter arcticus]